MKQRLAPEYLQRSGRPYYTAPLAWYTGIEPLRLSTYRCVNRSYA